MSIPNVGSTGTARVTASGIDYIDEALKGHAHTLCLPRGWSMSPIVLLNWSRFSTFVLRRMHRIRWFIVRAVPCRCIACDSTCPQLNKREPFRGGKLSRRPPSLTAPLNVLHTFQPSISNDAGILSDWASNICPSKVQVLVLLPPENPDAVTLRQKWFVDRPAACDMVMTGILL